MNLLTQADVCSLHLFRQISSWANFCLTVQSFHYTTKMAYVECSVESATAPVLNEQDSIFSLKQADTTLQSPTDHSRLNPQQSTPFSPTIHRASHLSSKNTLNQA